MHNSALFHLAFLVNISEYLSNALPKSKRLKFRYVSYIMLVIDLSKKQFLKLGRDTRSKSSTVPIGHIVRI